MRERKEAVALLEDQAERRAGFFQCPECLLHFESPEGLGSHLERHREVLPPTNPTSRGNPTSRPCPKNCGRHFTLKGGGPKDLRSHLQLCDGSEPLVVVIEEEPRKEAMVAKLECPKCGKKYLRGGSRYDKHVEECNDGSVEESPDLPSPKLECKESEGSGGGALAALLKSEGDVSIKDHTISMLETIETHYEGKLKQVKVLIAAVRNASEVEG